MKISQIYAVIKRFADKYSITTMCDFYHVSRSGYYDWLKRDQDISKDAELISMIAECHEESIRK